MEVTDRRARQPHPARGRRRVRHQSGDPEARDRRQGRQRAAREAEPDRHRHRDARRRCDGARRRLRERQLAPLGGNRRHDDRRPRRRHQRRPDQDRVGEPHGSRRQVQSAAAHRRGARLRREIRRTRRDQATEIAFGGPWTIGDGRCASDIGHIGHRSSPIGHRDMHKLVLLRHGQSTWNEENRFTGWKDVDLSALGIKEAHEAGRLMKDAGLVFDLAYTSVLRRAIKTLDIALDVMDQLWIPVTKHWRLNERHYGGLQGLNKAETAAKHGEDQGKIWRRSSDIPPPPRTPDDERYLGNDPRYKDLKPGEMPLSESLKDTVARFLPYWHETIAPTIRSGRRVVIAAHGNSLRALVKYLDAVSDA